MTDHHLDGNGVAGALASVFAGDPTTLARRCQGCGDTTPLGAHRAFRGAGLVLRCAGCDAVAVVVVQAGDEVRVQVHGTLAFAATA